jgi:hypothetical protein
MIEVQRRSHAGEKPKSPSSPEWPRRRRHAVTWLTTEDLPCRKTGHHRRRRHVHLPTIDHDAEADKLYAELKKILNHTDG